MIKIFNNQLEGCIDSISSKSIAHRHLICSSLSDGKTKLYINNFCKDILATIEVLRTLGAHINVYNDYIEISPITKAKENMSYNFFESGSTLRFAIPIIASLTEKSYYYGKGRLPQRPIKDLLQVLINNGCKISSYKLPFTINGNFKFNNISITGKISSQYISGLLLASPLQKEQVKINITDKLESKPYVEMTIDVMRKYGIEIIEQEKNFIVNSNNKYKTLGNFTIESDWSNSAFFLVAGAINDFPITVNNLNLNSKQGDKKILDILEKFGAKISITNNNCTVTKGNLIGTDVDISNIPDLLPILTILACASKGKSRFYNLDRLRLKESDRVESSVQMLKNLGAKIFQKDNEITIEGCTTVNGGNVDVFNDHRIAMAASIASIISKNPVFLNDENVVKKSYPNFFRDFLKLNARIEIF